MSSSDIIFLIVLLLQRLSLILRILYCRDLGRLFGSFSLRQCTKALMKFLARFFVTFLPIQKVPVVWFLFFLNSCSFLRLFLLFEWFLAESCELPTKLQVSLMRTDSLLNLMIVTFSSPSLPALHTLFTTWIFKSLISCRGLVKQSLNSGLSSTLFSMVTMLVNLQTPASIPKTVDVLLWGDVSYFGCFYLLRVKIFIRDEQFNYIHRIILSQFNNPWLRRLVAGPPLCCRQQKGPMIQTAECYLTDYHIRKQQSNYRLQDKLITIGPIEMSKQHNREISLPSISSQQQRAPLRSFLAIVVEKKNELKKRIMQTEQSDCLKTECNKNDPKNIRSKIITEIPMYCNSQHTLEAQEGLPCIQNFREGRKSHPLKQSGTQSRQRTEYKDLHVPPTSLRDNSSKKRNIVHENTSIASLGSILKQMPVRKDRNEENMELLQNYLMNNNILFKKIDPVVSLCMLKMNPLMVVERKKTLFKTGQQISAFYIILEGRVKLWNSQNNFTKICSPGECFFEEIFFQQQGPRKLALENVKTITKSYLLQVQAHNYSKTCKEMIRCGYKLPFMEMDSLLKRNFITKKWLRVKTERM